MELSKAFDCIRHDLLGLLIAELHVYGFSHEALTLINDYLTNRQQRFKVKCSFSGRSVLRKERPSTGCPTGVSLRPSVI